MKNDLLLVGAGSVGGYLALNITQINPEYTIIGFLDDDQEKHGKHFCGLPVLGAVEKITEFSKDTAVSVCINNPGIKRLKADQIQSHTDNFPVFVHPRAWVSDDVRIGRGSIIYPGVSINYSCRIGEFVTINMNCAIGHDCVIKDFSSLAPGVNFGGHTHIDEEVDIGIGAATKQNIRVGKGSVIGGQCMLIRDVPNGSVYAGVPGRELKNSQNR